jgi:hypothetical protein
LRRVNQSMYISGELSYLVSRLNQLPTGVADVNQFANEAKDYKARGLMPSGHLVQCDQIARLKAFQFSQNGADLSTPLVF